MEVCQEVIDQDNLVTWEASSTLNRCRGPKTEESEMRIFIGHPTHHMSSSPLRGLDCAVVEERAQGVRGNLIGFITVHPFDQPSSARTGSASDKVWQRRWLMSFWVDFSPPNPLTHRPQPEQRPHCDGLRIEEEGCGMGRGKRERWEMRDEIGEYVGDDEFLMDGCIEDEPSNPTEETSLGFM